MRCYDQGYGCLVKIVFFAKRMSCTPAIRIDIAAKYLSPILRRRVEGKDKAYNVPINRGNFRLLCTNARPELFGSPSDGIVHVVSPHKSIKAHP